MMSSVNTTNISISTFILTGIPGLEAAHIWIAFPLCSLYIIALVGNCTIIFAIKTEHSLHEPMYIFLSMLSFIDLLLSSCIMPRMLGLFWFNWREIAFDACLAQMFFIHFLSALESGILVAMAVDRYIAICHPLRYTSILTHSSIAKIGLVIIARGIAVMVPIPLLIKWLPFCRSNLLTHSFCLHQDAMNLACANIRVNIIYGLFVILSVMGIDSLFIAISYILIIKSMISLASDETGFKAFGTCTAHICAVLIFYIPLIGLSMVHRFGNNHFQQIPIYMANIYLLVPPVLNPIVYGVKTKQIRSTITKMLHHIRISRSKLCMHC
ncbi:olfactory receptor 51E1 isoform X1 [Microcaecilia unicolor]|uniref:Olfactory receptor n=1 Tax=Microcaecilia unicolor TaxID=1415580 RepID=A0A6P7XRJ0_9AMPH|nr:olfactory receptor 51E1-like isoform X1 [Microcaecilia unicolor]XP_030055702.1 olfactory receptor 51E1-like isoform X1 [Microcaecilia unicolor]XP_030055703.1 olfactory receptor 51E1-like isoform X1 [Microcaecilia unicolor]XP_030055704.1 olfactory receptor 51E1-like isoform X1 [Microcaecilia unicolor]XP_030055705.1 olfactory receptor 51E1-like isoform X1 [Microcaecilia unicolor]